MVPNENNVSRRGLLMKLGILFNGIVAAALAVPIVRFLLSSLTRGRRARTPDLLVGARWDEQEKDEVRRMTVGGVEIDAFGREAERESRPFEAFDDRVRDRDPIADACR